MSSSSRARGLAGWLPALVLAATASAQGPAEAPRAPVPVRVDAMVLYVSSQPGGIDPRAQELASMLEKEFKLQTLRVLQMQQMSLAMRQMGQMELPTGHWVSVQPEEITAQGLRMGVEVQGMLRTHVRVPSGNQVVIGAYSYEDGRIVVRLAPVYEMPPLPTPVLLPAPGPGGAAPQQAPPGR